MKQDRVPRMAGEQQAVKEHPWWCPSCDCPGHATPTLEDVPRRHRGDNREIYRCVWCAATICTCCYSDHLSEKHPEVYGRKPVTSKKAERKRKRRR